MRQRSTIGIKPALRQSLTLALIAGGTIGLPWIAHGIISSGYPFFPSTFGALPVDWKIPTSITVEARDWIYSFAREPHVDSDVVFSSWQWVAPWFARMQSGFEYFLFTLPFYVFVAAVIFYVMLLFIFARTLRKGQRIDWRLWLPVIPAAFFGVTRLFNAPHPRFSGATVLVFRLWGFCMAWSVLQHTP